jgi:hypothetical protein
MNIIFEEAYSYILVKDDQDWYLTFFTGGPVEIDICVKLTDAEIAKVSKSKNEAAKLAGEFQQDRSLFSGRRVIPSVVPGVI